MKPREEDAIRTISHLADSVAFNEKHARTHVAETCHHAAKLVKFIKNNRHFKRGYRELNSRRISKRRR